MCRPTVNVKDLISIRADQKHAKLRSIASMATEFRTSSIQKISLQIVSGKRY